MNSTIDQLKAELAELEPKVRDAWTAYKNRLDEVKPLESEWTRLIIKEQGLKAAITIFERLEQTQPK